MWDIKRELNTIRPRRVGLLGGTFDPIHLGHLTMAQDALEMCALDEVCLIPCATPPHKCDSKIAPAEHRLAMLEAAIAADPRLSRSLIELDRGSVSYTMETVAELKASAPDIEFFLIIGGDTLFEIHSWKEIDKLLKAVAFIAVARPGFDFGKIDSDSLHLSDDQVECIKKYAIVGHEMQISSTDVRARVAEGLGIRYLVLDPVAEYISRHNLYGAM